MSIIQPSLSTSGKAIALEEVWRPRPVASFTSPVTRSASGTRALIRVDLPTPECPTKTEIFPSRIWCSFAKSLARESLLIAVWIISTSSSEYSARNGGTSLISVFVTTIFGIIPSVKAETRKRSIRPRRGSGLAAATTITS